MSTRFDVIVLGIGAMGSATAWRLAARGAKVLGLEQFFVGHALGSSHGESRLIRQAYFEHPNYVPLLRTAYNLWHELERETGRSLFHQNGVVIFGPKDGVIMQGVRHSSKVHGVKIVEYSAEKAATAFSAYRPSPGHEALLEPGAGYLEVEACVIAQAEAARAHGAIIREQEAVTAIVPIPGGMRVSTDSGTYEATRLVVTAGAWSGRFLDSIKPQLKVHRVPLVWFAAEPRYSVRTGLPCFGFELPEGFFYGVPAISDRGVKMGLHIPGTLVTNPATIDRSLTADDLKPLVDFIGHHLPGVTPVPLHHAICMYTMSPDEHFILDSKGSVTYAAGFSGHGFKFAPVIGDALADLALDGSTSLPIEFLRPR